MTLVNLWFWLVAGTFTLYFFLEGFDFGVDILRLLDRIERPDRLDRRELQCVRRIAPAGCPCGSSTAHALQDPTA